MKRTITANKLKIISISIVILIGIIFLIQTYSKALREGGYDFTSYLLSSQALVNCLNPYTTGSQFPYIYPLFLASVLIPLVLIPYKLAVFTWFVINVASMIYSIDYLFRCNDKYNRKFFYGLPLLLLVLLILNVLQNNLLNGQVNLFVLFLSVLYLNYLSKNKLITAAVFLSAAIAIKLVPLIFLLMALRKEKLQVIVYTILFSLIFILFLPMVFTGNSIFEYYEHYVNNFLLGGISRTSGSDEMSFNLSGFLIYLFPGLNGVVWIKYLSALLIVLTVMHIDYRWVKNNFNYSGIHVFSLYAVSILLINTMSETHHLVFILPGLSLLLYELVIKQRFKDFYILITFILFIILFWIGEISKGGPFHFIALVILFFIIILEIKKNNIDDKVTKQI